MESISLLGKNKKDIFLFGRIQTRKTGDRPYSDTSPYGECFLLQRLEEIKGVDYNVAPEVVMKQMSPAISATILLRNLPHHSPLLFCNSFFLLTNIIFSSHECLSLRENLASFHDLSTYNSQSNSASIYCLTTFL